MLKFLSFACLLACLAFSFFDFVVVPLSQGAYYPLKFLPIIGDQTWAKLDDDQIYRHFQLFIWLSFLLDLGLVFNWQRAYNSRRFTLVQAGGATIGIFMFISLLYRQYDVADNNAHGIFFTDSWLVSHLVMIMLVALLHFIAYLWLARSPNTSTLCGEDGGVQPTAVIRPYVDDNAVSLRTLWRQRDYVPLIYYGVHVFTVCALVLFDLTDVSFIHAKIHNMTFFSNVLLFEYRCRLLFLFKHVGLLVDHAHLGLTTGDLNYQRFFNVTFFAVTVYTTVAFWSRLYAMHFFISFVCMVVEVICITADVVHLFSRGSFARVVSSSLKGDRRETTLHSHSRAHDRRRSRRGSTKSGKH